MIKVDRSEYILKVLDINANQVEHIKGGLWNRLAGLAEYIDTTSCAEHMYSCEILDKLHGCIPETDQLSEEDKVLIGTLVEIQSLCEKYSCSYFRLIDLPFNRSCMDKVNRMKLKAI